MRKQTRIISVLLGATIVITGLLTIGAKRERSAEETAAARARLVEAREKLIKEVDRYIAVTENVASPLAKLNEDQIASIVALSYIARSVELVHSPNTRLARNTTIRFKDKLDSISSGLGRVTEVKSPIFACIEESIGCVTALASCDSEDPPRSEEECFESWGPCAEELSCVWGRLEAMKGRINDIFGGLRPPRPIPWPE